MEDNTFDEMHKFLKKMLQKYPDDKEYKNMYSQLIDKKKDYDQKKLEMQKEMVINYQNNYLSYCLEDMRFRMQWEIIQKASGFSLSPQISFNN